MRNRTIIILVCLAAFALRLVFLAQSPELAAEAYPTIRQVEHIRDTGFPLVHDLETGSSFRPLPLFPYVIAFGTLLMPTQAAYTLLPNVIAVLLHAAIFLLALELTADRRLATIAAIGSLALPGYLSLTLFTLSPLALALPLLLFAVLRFIKLRKTKEQRLVLLTVVAALLATHPIALIFVPSVLIALGLATIRRAPNLTIQYEFALFATFLSILTALVLYRDALIGGGSTAFTANAPQAIVSATYGNPGLLAIALAAGIVPFGLALYAAYKEGAALHPGIQVTIALASVSMLALLLELVPTTLGTTLFAIACAPLAAVGLQHLIIYGRTLRRATLPSITALVFIALFVATSGIATAAAGVAATHESIPAGLTAAGMWLRENSLPNAVILSEPALGAAVATLAHRPVYIDNWYIGETDSQRRYALAEQMLNGEGVGTLPQRAGISYIVTTTPIRHDCVHTVYREPDVAVQKVLCT